MCTCRRGAVLSLSAVNADAMRGNCTAADGAVRSDAGALDRAAVVGVRLPGVTLCWQR